MLAATGAVSCTDFQAVSRSRTRVANPCHFLSIRDLRPRHPVLKGRTGGVFFGMGRILKQLSMPGIAHAGAVN